MLLWKWTFLLICDSSYMLNTKKVHLVTPSPEMYLSPRFPRLEVYSFLAKGFSSNKQDGVAWLMVW